MRVLLVDNEINKKSIQNIYSNINILYKDYIHIDFASSFEDAEYFSFIRDYDLVLVFFKNIYYKKIKGFLLYLDKRNKNRHQSSNYINKTKVNLIKRESFRNMDIDLEKGLSLKSDRILIDSNSFVEDYLESFFKERKFLSHELFNFGKIEQQEYFKHLSNHIEYEYKNIACLNDLLFYNKNYILDINLKHLRKKNALHFLNNLGNDSFIVTLRKNMDFKIFYWLVRHYKEYLSIDNIICGLSPDPEKLFNYSIESSFTSIRKHIKQNLPPSIAKNFNPILISKKVGYQLCF